MKYATKGNPHRNIDKVLALAAKLDADARDRWPSANCRRRPLVRVTSYRPSTG